MGFDCEESSRTSLNTTMASLYSTERTAPGRSVATEHYFLIKQSPHTVCIVVTGCSVHIDNRIDNSRCCLIYLYDSAGIVDSPKTITVGSQLRAGGRCTDIINILLTNEFQFCIYFNYICALGNIS